jgi:hypothetical protein
MASYYVDARHATINHVTGEQLNVSHTDANRELISLIATSLHILTSGTPDSKAYTRYTSICRGRFVEPETGVLGRHQNSPHR